MHLRMRPTPTGTLDVSVTESATNGAGVSEQPPHPQPRGSSRGGREQSTHYPRAMPHVDHSDGTPSSGDTCWRSHRQARRRCLLHAGRQQGHRAPPPPSGTATSCSADLGRNRTRAELPAQPNRTRGNADGPSQGGNNAAAAGGDRQIIPHRDPDGGGSDGGSSNHGANKRAGGGGGRYHANSHASGASQGGYDARQKIEELRRKKSATAGDNDGFPAFSPRLRNLLLPDKFKPLGITKYDAKQDPIQWLRCYALSIENVAVTRTPSASTSRSAWTRLPSHGSSRWTSTRSTSGTS
jgi:hypothetical protein